MKFFVFLFSLLFLVLPASAEKIDLSMQVGETVEVVLYKEQNDQKIEPSAFIPMPWCTVTEMNGEILLCAAPPAVGQWTIDLRIRAYGQNDKKGHEVASCLVNIEVLPDAFGNLYHTDYAYANDGQGMVGVNKAEVPYCRVPGGPVMEYVHFGKRLICTSIESFANEQWYRVYDSEFGYGYIRGDHADALYAYPLQVNYTSGIPIEIVLWHTENRLEDVRLQLHESLDGELEDIVFFSKAGDNGTWYTMMRATLTGNELHARHKLEIVCYNQDQRPIEVVTVIATPREE